MSPPSRWARTASPIALRRVEIRPGRSLANQSSRLAVASASGRARWPWAQLDAEEAGQVTELVRLGAGIALAGDDQGVEVGPGLEPESVALGVLDEAEVEADVVADDERVPDELQQLIGRLLRAGRALDVLVGDAVHLVADDRAAGVHERRPAVDDLRCP